MSFFKSALWFLFFKKNILGFGHQMKLILFYKKKKGFQKNNKWNGGELKCSCVYLRVKQKGHRPDWRLSVTSQVVWQSGKGMIYQYQFVRATIMY